MSYELRELCQFLAKAMSALLSSKEQHDGLGYRQRIRRGPGQLLEPLNAQDNFIEGLYRQSPTLLSLTAAGWPSASKTRLFASGKPLPSTRLAT